MKKLAGSDKGRDERTRVSGSVQAGEQRYQFLTGVSVFDQRIAQRVMPDPALAVTRGIGGLESERVLFIPALDQMEKDPFRDRFPGPAGS